MCRGNISVSVYTIHIMVGGDLITFFEKYITLLFAVLTVSLFLTQYACSACSPSCKPSSLSANNTISSAYLSTVIRVPWIVTPTASSKSFIKLLNNDGERHYPCINPVVKLKVSLHPASVLTLLLTLLYMFIVMTLIKQTTLHQGYLSMICLIIKLFLPSIKTSHIWLKLINL